MPLERPVLSRGCASRGVAAPCRSPEFHWLRRVSRGIATFPMEREGRRFGGTPTVNASPRRRSTWSSFPVLQTTGYSPYSRLTTRICAGGLGWQ